MVTTWCLFASYIPVNLASAATSQNCIPADKLKLFSKEKEWVIHASSLDHINEWAKQNRIVWMRNLQRPSLTAHQFAKLLLQGRQPRIRSYGQKPYVMTEQTLAAAIKKISDMRLLLLSSRIVWMSFVVAQDCGLWTTLRKTNFTGNSRFKWGWSYTTGIYRSF